MSHPTSQLYTDWVLPPEISRGLETYYLLYWDESWFRERVEPPNLLLHSTKLYKIYFLNNPLVGASGRVAVSFRKQKGQKYGIALVRFVPRKCETHTNEREDDEPTLF